MVVKKDRDDGRFGEGVTIMIKESIWSVLGLLPEIPFIDILACDISRWTQQLVFTRLRPPNSPYAADNSLITMRLLLFKLLNRIILVSDFNACYINWDTLAHTLTLPSKHKLLSFVRDNFVLQHIISPTRYQSDTLPSPTIPKTSQILSKYNLIALQ